MTVKVRACLLLINLLTNHDVDLLIIEHIYK